MNHVRVKKMFKVTEFCEFRGFMKLSLFSYSHFNGRCFPVHVYYFDS